MLTDVEKARLRFIAQRDSKSSTMRVITQCIIRPLDKRELAEARMRVDAVRAMEADSRNRRWLQKDRS